jgi:hypothetical protein
MTLASHMIPLVRTSTRSSICDTVAADEDAVECMHVCQHHVSQELGDWILGLRSAVSQDSNVLDT